MVTGFGGEPQGLSKIDPLLFLQNLTKVIPTAIDIYNGVANTTFLGLEFDLIKAFTHPKDAKEQTFVSLRFRVNDTGLF